MTAAEPAAPHSSDGPAPQAKSPAARPPVHLFLYVDGACSGNPGPCGSAAIIKDEEGTTLLEKMRAFGPGTNNEAEYQALILGLETAAQLKPDRLTIRSDSELMVRQVAGQYRIKAQHLKPLHTQVMRLLAPFKAVEIEHIRRELNTDADKLSKVAVEKAMKVDATIPATARKVPVQKTFKLK
jgi:ribonuclease HI